MGLDQAEAGDAVARAKWRSSPWLLEEALPLFSFATPKKYRSITVETIARAMVATSRQPPEASAVYHYPEMTRLAAG